MEKETEKFKKKTEKCSMFKYSPNEKGMVYGPNG